MSDNPLHLVLQVRVVGCIHPGFATVATVGPHGCVASPFDVPLELVPYELRFPNVEFMLTVDRRSGDILKIELPAN